MQKHLIKKYFCFLLLFFICFKPASLKAYSSSTKISFTRAPKRGSFNTRQFVIDFLKLYAKEWLVLGMHELGHAATANMFANGATEIHLGGSYGDKVKLFNLGKKNLFFHSFLPVGGWTTHKAIGGWRNIAIALAGPICGALTWCMLHMLSDYNKEKNALHNQSKVAFLKRSFKKNLYNVDSMTHLIINLFPYAGNDGAHICKEVDSSINTNKQIFGILRSQIAILYLMIHLAKSGDPLAREKDVIRRGNKILMNLSNNTLTALKEWSSKENFSFYNNTNFEVSDLLYLEILYDYMQAVKRVYVK